MTENSIALSSSSHQTQCRSATSSLMPVFLEKTVIWLTLLYSARLLMSSFILTSSHLAPHWGFQTYDGGRSSEYIRWGGHSTRRFVVAGHVGSAASPWCNNTPELNKPSFCPECRFQVVLNQTTVCFGVGSGSTGHVMFQDWAITVPEEHEHQFSNRQICMEPLWFRQ